MSRCHPERSNREAIAQSKDLGTARQSIAGPLGALAVLLLLFARPSHAQSPSDHARLSSWADSLRSVASATAIDSYEGASRLGADRIGDLRRALYQVRHADLTGNRGEIELVLTNMQVMANHSNSAWPHYVMALAFEAMARKHWVETLSDGKELAEKHSDAVWRTLRASLDRDSTFAPARRMLAQLTAAQGDRFLRSDQEVALRREAHLPDADPDALLAWGRHLRTIREYRAALTAFALSIDHGGDRARSELEIARTLMATGDAKGAVGEYWEGLAHLTPTGRELYRFDLEWIVDSTALNQFDALPDSGVATWLARFWNSRDAEAANYPGDRLKEHLRRWVKVMENYRALSPWKDAFFSRVEMGFDYDPGDAALLDPTLADPIKKSSCTEHDASLFEQLWRMQPWHSGDLRTREPLLDHRGLIYLRHGEPQRRIDGGGAPGGGLLGGPIVRRTRPTILPVPQARGPNHVLLPWSSAGLGEAPDRPNGAAGESWIYGLGGTWHILQFRGSVALGNYAATTLTQRVPAEWLSDPATEATIPGMTFVQLARRVDKEESSPMRKALRDRMGKSSCYQEAVAIAAQTRADEHFFINQDTDTPPGLQPSNSVAQAFALGVADDHSGEALVSFAIASEILTLDHDSSGASGYTIAFRIVAYDKAADRTIAIDTAQRFTVRQPLLPGRFLTTHFEFPLPAGNWHVAVRAQQAGGAVALNESHNLHVDAAAALTLSDIVTGRPGSPPWAATDRMEFPINYPNGWYSGETAELFFEVRGVPAGAEYRTSMEVRPVDPKVRGTIQIQSNDRGADGASYVRKTLGLTQLAPGRYRLQVTVEYQGRKAVREREILIVNKP